MTIRSALMLYYRKYVRYNKKLPGKNGIEDIVEAIYDRKLGRKASMGTGKGAAKDMMGHGDSRQMEMQLDELKAMVAQLAAAQARQIRSTSTNSRSPSPVSGSLKSRSYDTRSGSKGRSGRTVAVVVGAAEATGAATSRSRCGRTRDRSRIGPAAPPLAREQVSRARQRWD